LQRAELQKRPSGGEHRRQVLKPLSKSQIRAALANPSRFPLGLPHSGINEQEMLHFSGAAKGPSKIWLQLTLEMRL